MKQFLRNFKRKYPKGKGFLEFISIVVVAGFKHKRPNKIASLLKFVKFSSEEMLLCLNEF